VGRLAAKYVKSKIYLHHYPNSRIKPEESWGIVITFWSTYELSPVVVNKTPLTCMYMDKQKYLAKSVRAGVIQENLAQNHSPLQMGGPGATCAVLLVVVE